jgi:DNA-binding NarL/FixJ family response regulator
MRRPVRVLSVDDHSFLVEGLRARLSLERDIELIDALESAEHLITTVRDQRPDIVLLDIEMPGPDAFDSAAELVRLFPDTRVIFLSAYVRDHYISSATKAGAWGYFSKADETDELIEGIRRVADGRFAFGPKVRARCQPVRGAKRGEMAPPASRVEALSPREIEVLRLIGRGLTRAEIAKTLSRSPKTVDGHRESIMTKLDIHDRGQLVRFAIEEGLVEP